MPRGCRPAWRISSIFASGYRSKQPPGIPVPEDRDVEGLEIALEKAGALEIRVLDSLGEAGRRRLRSEVRQTDSPAPERRGRTDAEGRCRLEGIEPGRYEVSARSEEQGQARTTLNATAGVTARDLVLTKGVEVSGRVSDESGEPVPGASLSLQPVGKGCRPHGARRRRRHLPVSVRRGRDVPAGRQRAGLRRDLRARGGPSRGTGGPRARPAALPGRHADRKGAGARAGRAGERPGPRRAPRSGVRPALAGTRRRPGAVQDRRPGTRRLAGDRSPVEGAQPSGTPPDRRGPPGGRPRSPVPDRLHALRPGAGGSGSVRGG